MELLHGDTVRLRNHKACVCTFFAVVFLASLAGCRNTGDRPKLGLVVGTIRLDGQPLPDVRVVFKAAGTRAAFGATDANGEYYLVYLRDIKGAAVGEHQVKLFDMNKPENASGFGRIPKKYGSGAESLAATVVAGEQVINFDLTSSPK